MADFQGMTKHVGVINNTGKNVAVVYMQLPNDPAHALVVDTDALPDEYNDVLRRIIDSQEGQDIKNLGDILGRKMAPDGSNLTILQKFHAANRLEVKPVDQITMTPRRGISWPLKDILAAMDTVKEDTIPGFDDLDPETRAAVAADLGKFNMHAQNQDVAASALNVEQAANLLEMAKMLEADAHAKRTQAYMLNPSLKPAAKPLSKLEALPAKKTAAKAPAKTVKTPAKTKAVKANVDLSLHAAADPKPRARKNV